MYNHSVVAVMISNIEIIFMNQCNASLCKLPV